MVEAVVVKRTARVVCRRMITPVQQGPVPSGNRAPGRFDWQLRLQARLDGELLEGEPAADTSATATEAKLLLRELKLIKVAFANNEAEHRVPESREAYWKRINRIMTRSSKAH